MSNFPDDFNPGLSGCFPPLRRNSRPDYEDQVARLGRLSDRVSHCANRLPDDGDQSDSNELEAINAALAQIAARVERLAIP